MLKVVSHGIYACRVFAVSQPVPNVFKKEMKLIAIEGFHKIVNCCLQLTGTAFLSGRAREIRAATCDSKTVDRTTHRRILPTRTALL